ncbi:MAG: methyltransferase domain-containing protein [Acidobacteriota bacterium]|jgi:ubiquinone/menaquinone biosynthesis C-methylase UbiE|nr:methyltransferase domain-containing protein [Acidobacteriota bacterium]
MKPETPRQKLQKEFDFSPPQPRPFVAGLPARLDEYEEGIAGFFQRKTGLDYYLTMDRIIDFVIGAGRTKVVDLLTDTAAFPLRLAERKAFNGHIYSFDSNVTLTERAKQRAIQLNLAKAIEFRQFQEMQIPLADDFADAAVSIFDLHRHPAGQYLVEIRRILAPEGLLVLAEYTEVKSAATVRLWRKARLRYIEKNPVEADATYPDREEVIEWLFDAGFRQVVIQEMNAPSPRHLGVFSLVAATK